MQSCNKCQHYGNMAITCNQQKKCPLCAFKHNAKNCDKVGEEQEIRFQMSETKCANVSRLSKIQNNHREFQDCYYNFQGSPVPAAILSRRPYSTVCTNTITAIFFIVAMYSYSKNRNGQVQIIFICCLECLE